MTCRPNHRGRSLAGLAVLTLFAPMAHAIDSIVLEVREMTVAGMPVKGASVRLELPGGDQARVLVQADEVLLPDPAGRFTQLALSCDRPVIAEPRFGCEAGRFTARGGPTGSLDMQVRAELRSDTGVTTFSGRGVKFAGTTASFDGQLDEKGWQVRGSTGAAKLSELRKFMAPWFQLPADVTGEGQVRIEGQASDAGKGLVADGSVSLEAWT
jgi:hypothetical protein